MKVTVASADKLVEPLCELLLDQRGDSVYLIGRDSFGQAWNILRISSEGITRLAIHPNVRWPLDSIGRMKLTDV